MSTLNTTNIKNASSSTNNIVLASDGSTTVGNLAATQIRGGAITSGTAVASTSGTSIDFTGIPSWVKRVTVMFNGVSTNGSSALIVRLGTSAGGIDASGYAGSVGAMLSTNCNSSSLQTTGFDTYYSAAAIAQSGMMFIANVSGNIWSMSYNIAYVNGSYPMGFGAGIKTLSGTLDRVRITTVNGTDTFDAGSINILYEG
jgi:hypothetical protein